MLHLDKSFIHVREESLRRDQPREHVVVVRLTHVVMVWKLQIFIFLDKRNSKSVGGEVEYSISGERPSMSTTRDPENKVFFF